jgi:hypothetical protein
MAQILSHTGELVCTVDHHDIVIEIVGIIESPLPLAVKSCGWGMVNWRTQLREMSAFSGEWCSSMKVAPMPKPHRIGRIRPCRYWPRLIAGLAELPVGAASVSPIRNSGVVCNSRAMGACAGTSKALSPTSKW